MFINPLGFSAAGKRGREREKEEVGMKSKVLAAALMIMQSHERGKHPRAIDDDRDTFQSFPFFLSFSLFSVLSRHKQAQ